MNSSLLRSLPDIPQFIYVIFGEPKPVEVYEELVYSFCGLPQAMEKFATGILLFSPKSGESTSENNQHPRIEISLIQYMLRPLIIILIK